MANGHQSRKYFINIQRGGLPKAGKCLQRPRKDEMIYRSEFMEF